MVSTARVVFSGYEVPPWIRVPPVVDFLFMGYRWGGGGLGFGPEGWVYTLGG